MKVSHIAILLMLFQISRSTAQESLSAKDSLNKITTFSGMVGITNNGFSIIPSFSLNSPAFITNLSWRKKQWSFEPDVRIVPNATKGGMILWLRYRAIEKNKFSLRFGVHPAINLLRDTITTSGEKRAYTEMLRFGAFEIVPSYQISKHFGVSAMYLQGHGFQKFGPQFTNVLFLNTAITALGLGKSLHLSFFPSVFFIQSDGYRGNYFTLTSVLGIKKSPFSLSSTINQTIKSNLPGNRYFMWNIGVNYGFKRQYNPIH